MSNVEVYEDYVAKSRLNHDDGERERDVVDDGLDRFHLVFHYSIKEFNKDLGLKILDWLAFKEEIDHLPFKEEQIKRLGKTRSTS